LESSYTSVYPNLARGLEGRKINLEKSSWNYTRRTAKPNGPLDYELWNYFAVGCRNSLKSETWRIAVRYYLAGLSVLAPENEGLQLAVYQFILKQERSKICHVLKNLVERSDNVSWASWSIQT